jgi:hypothetical protein
MISNEGIQEVSITKRQSGGPLYTAICKSLDMKTNQRFTSSGFYSYSSRGLFTLAE